MNFAVHEITGLVVELDPSALCPNARLGVLEKHVADRLGLARRATNRNAVCGEHAPAAADDDITFRPELRTVLVVRDAVGVDRNFLGPEPTTHLNRGLRCRCANQSRQNQEGAEQSRCVTNDHARASVTIGSYTLLRPDFTRSPA